MSDDTDRLLRIKSLINRDMQSVRGRTQPVQPAPPHDSAFQQRKQQLEAQDVAIREKTQQQRQQRQLHHRQRLISEATQRAALKEQKQKQEAMRVQKEHASRQKIQQQLRTTIPSPHEARGEGKKNFAKNTPKNPYREKKSESNVLELTTLVRQGPSSEQRAALSRTDARLYSPFAHTRQVRAFSQRSSRRSVVQSLGASLLAFLLDPFLLLWRTLLWPYRMVRSIPQSSYRYSPSPQRSPARSPARQGSRRGLADTTVKALRAGWHFASAPLHLLAHAVIDPLGMFTRQPHNYPRLPLSIYARIFVQQLQRNFLILLRGARHLVQTLGRFVASPFLLLVSIVLLPWRSLRYGRAHDVADMLSDSGAGFWRRARIRSIGFRQLLQSRMLVIFRARRAQSIRTAGETKLLVGGIAIREVARMRRYLPSLWRALKRSGRRFLIALTTSLVALARRTEEARKPILERQAAAARAVTSARAPSIGKSDTMDDTRGNTMGDTMGNTMGDTMGDRREEDLPKTDLPKEDLPKEDLPKAELAKASMQAEQVPSVATDKKGLFASGEHSLLEDFFASEDEAGQEENLAQSFEVASTQDKEADYLDMDKIRSEMEGQGSPPKEHKSEHDDTDLVVNVSSERAAASEEAKLFEEVEGLDEEARAKLLQRLTSRVEGEKLR